MIDTVHPSAWAVIRGRSNMTRSRSDESDRERLDASGGAAKRESQ